MEKPFLKLPFEYKGAYYNVFNEKHIEGGIKNLTEEFALREKMNQAVGLTSADFLPFAEAICAQAVKDGLSVVATEKDGSFIASLFASEFTDNIFPPAQNNKLNPVMSMLSQVVSRYSEEFLNLKTYYLNIVAVPLCYKGRGIGFNLWIASLIHALNLGFNSFAGTLTDGPCGPNSTLCLEKMKFQKLYEVRYQDYEYEGKKVFSGIKDAECCFFAMRTLHSQEELWEILGNKTINLDI